MRNLKKFLALALAVMMVFSLFVTVNASTFTAADADAMFTDAVAPEYEEALTALVAMGIFQGIENADGTLSLDPQGHMTRAQFATVLYRLHSGDTNEKNAESYAQYASNFTDVAGKWYEGVAGYAYHNGLMVGVDDNKFGGSTDIKGVQVLTALLRVLGYRRAEYEGTGYTTEVKRDALTIGLTAGLVSASAIDSYATREQIVQMAYYALQTPIAKKDNNGNYLYQARGTENAYTLGMDSYGVEELTGPAAEKAAGKDPFGRPAASKVWVVGDDVIVVEGPEAVWSTYKTETKLDEVKALEGFDKGALTEDGKPGDEVADAAALAKLTGNGVQVEVYKKVTAATKDDEKDKVEWTVVVINTYAVVLTDEMIIAADEDEEIEAHIELTVTVGDAEVTVTSDDTGYKKDDVVLFTVAYDSTSKEYAVVKLDKISASVSGAVSHAGDDYIRIDSGDTKYYLAKNPANTAEGKAYALPTDPAADGVKGKTFGFYLDSYGYVVYAAENVTADGDDEVTYESSYVFVEKFQNNVNSDGSGDDNDLIDDGSDTPAPIVKAKVVDLTTGETSVVDIAVGQKSGKWYYLTATGTVGNTEVTKIEDAKKAPYVGTFALLTDLEDGTYALTAGTAKAVAGEEGADLAAFKIDKGEGAITINAKSETVDALSTTTLTILTVTEPAKDDEDGVTTYSAETVTGYKNFPGMLGSGVKANENKLPEATAVYYLTNSAGSVTAIYVTVVAKAEETTTVGVYAGAGEKTAAGTGYDFYVDGVKTTYYHSGDALKADVGTLYTITSKTEDGKTTVEVEAVKKGETYEENFKLATVTSEYIKSEEKTIYLASGCAVLQLTMDGKTSTTKDIVVDGVTTSTIKKVVEGKTVNVYLNSDGEAELIIIQVEKTDA